MHKHGGLQQSDWDVSLSEWGRRVAGWRYFPSEVKAGAVTDSLSGCMFDYRITTTDFGRVSSEAEQMHARIFCCTSWRRDRDSQRIQFRIKVWRPTHVSGQSGQHYDFKSNMRQVGSEAAEKSIGSGFLRCVLRLTDAAYTAKVSERTILNRNMPATARNTLAQLLALYTNLESHNAHRHRQRDRQTDEQQTTGLCQQPIILCSRSFCNWISASDS